MEVSNCWKMNKKILIKTLNHKKLKLMNRCNNSVALNRFGKLKIQTRQTTINENIQMQLTLRASNLLWFLKQHLQEGLS